MKQILINIIEDIKTIESTLDSFKFNTCKNLSSNVEEITNPSWAEIKEFRKQIELNQFLWNKYVRLKRDSLVDDIFKILEEEVEEEL